MKICVFGAASPHIDNEYIRAVEALGEIIAKRGHELVFGAGRNGLMGAAAEGAYKAGGRLHGVVPRFFSEMKIEALYPGCHRLTYTDTMRERKRIMEDEADAFIIVPGGVGTFEEFFEVLTLKQLGRHQKPIVVYNLKGYYDEIFAALDASVGKGFVTEECLSLFVRTSSAEKAVDYAENASGCDFSVKDLKQG